MERPPLSPHFCFCNFQHRRRCSEHGDAPPPPCAATAAAAISRSPSRSGQPPPRRTLSPRAAPATVAFPFVRVAAAAVHAQAAALASPLHPYYTTGSLPNTATATDSPLRQHHNHHLLSPDNG
ncbi:uncharacterized protein LOC121807602 [Salvia splendens]|uniref:uncharacterized protein LOC121807602 n=1 Tax=Salvia splendens TaxID=180675 RepID=UPI001102B3B5|nr:uncharacterized protein LOC121807602 [Salvia splendens]